jgi:citrate lyase beta subunit
MFGGKNGQKHFICITMERLRRTMMFIPGNNPSMMQDAYIYHPDSIMLDLEDSVTVAEKDAARLLVYQALKTVDYGTIERVVRNQPTEHSIRKERHRSCSERWRRCN